MEEKMLETPLDSKTQDFSSNAVFVISEIEKECQLTDVKEIVSQKLDAENSSLVVIGNLCADSVVQSVMSHLVQLLRKHSLHKTEREMLLSYEDMLVTVQLCLAENNKQKNGDFDIEASTVIEMHKLLIDEKLGVSKNTQSSCPEYAELRSSYDSYLQQCNLLDCIDVLTRIKEETVLNEQLNKEIKETSFLMLNYTTNKVEQEMLKLLAQGKKCYTTTVECSLDDSLIESGSFVLEECNLAEKLSGTLGRSINTPGNIGGRSVTEKYAERVLMSYLHLLINSRSELALAQVINIPERDLDHKAFTALKHEAQKKRVSMFQTAVSYVMRIRLGGKSYQPDRNSPLAQYVKGMAEFTDLIQKLVTIIEEECNTRLAIKKVLNIIKNTFVRCRDNTLRKTSIEEIATKLKSFAESTIEGYEKQEESSPKRDAHNGGSLVGRRTLRVVRAIVDRYASRLPSSTSHIETLTDVFSSQATPIRFPSLMSKFRSPLESSPDAIESQSLSMRMKNKFQSQQQSKREFVPRFQTNMDWALPLHDVGLNRENSNSLTIDDYVPSKTVVHAATKCDKSNQGSIARKVLESIHDQENAVDIPYSTSSQSTGSCNQSKNSTNTKKKAQGTSNISLGGKSQKRTLTDASQLSQPATKKAKKTQPKKKALPLQKGQKQLTAFFRV